jgi:hypothetical protein
LLIILVAAFLFVKEERNAVENRVLMRSGNTIRPFAVLGEWGFTFSSQNL